MESIGNRLKQARQAKKLSLDEVASNTKIQKKILISLEEDKLDDALSPFYAKNFLKSYAQYLDLNSSKLVEEYLAINERLQPAPQLMVKKAPVFYYNKKFIRGFALSLGLIAVISLCSYTLKFGLTKIKQKRTQKAKYIKPMILQSKISIPKDMPLKLSATALKNTWVMIRADGKVIFQNVITAGQTESWIARKAIDMWVGNAGGITLTLNEYKLGSPGKYGQVIKNILFTHEGMKIEK